MQPDDDVPRAHRYQFFGCNNPECFMHVVLFDRFERPMAEGTMTEDQARELIEFARTELYMRAVERDHNDGEQHRDHD